MWLKDTMNLSVGAWQINIHQLLAWILHMVLQFVMFSFGIPYLWKILAKLLGTIAVHKTIIKPQQYKTQHISDNVL